VSALAFAEGGDEIVATGEGGGLWLWRDDLPRERDALRRAIEAATAATESP
jgi:hypothetical protein